MAYTHIKRWTMPECYFGEEWHSYYSSGFGQSRDSDSLERSNFAVALSELGGESDTVIVVRASHWAVGWVEWIAIHETDGKALATADSLKERQSDYPILDEDHWGELEWTESADYWDSMSPRHKVQWAMDIRKRYHWLLTEPVWNYGRLSYGELANLGTTISEAICESLRG